MTTYTPSQATYLTDLHRTIKHKREQLIEDMRRLANRLTDEANRLVDDPEREPDSLGYVSPTSLSRDVDRRAIELRMLMTTLRDVNSMLER